MPDELRNFTYRQRRRASKASLLEESVGHVHDGTDGRVAIERTEGSVELLEGLNTEPRHDDGFRGYRGR